MICEKPPRLAASSLAGSVPASDIVSMPKSPMSGSGPSADGLPLRSSSFIVYELEHHAAEITLGQCTARFRMHVARFDEFDAALAQRRRSLQDVGRAEADALQHLV